MARATIKKATQKALSKRVVKKVISKSVSKRQAAQKRTKKVEETILYKAFGVEGGRLVSKSVKGPLKLTYAIGKKTASPAELLKLGYGIMVFETKEQAKNWGGCDAYGSCKDHPILKVRCGEVFDVPAKRLHRNVLGYRADGYSRYSEEKSIFEGKLSWRTIASRLVKSLDVENNWPRGTKMASYVIPVQDEE